MSVMRGIIFFNVLESVFSLDSLEDGKFVFNSFFREKCCFGCAKHLTCVFTLFLVCVCALLSVITVCELLGFYRSRVDTCAHDKRVLWVREIICPVHVYAAVRSNLALNASHVGMDEVVTALQESSVTTSKHKHVPAERLNTHCNVTCPLTMQWLCRNHCYVVMFGGKQLRNLFFQLPELAGFLLFSVIPQLLLALFLLFNEAAIILPLDRAVNIVLSILVVIEIIFSLRTCIAMSRQQTNKFHLQQFVDLEQLPSHDVDPMYGGSAQNTMTRRKAARAWTEIFDEDANVCCRCEWIVISLYLLTTVQYSSCAHFYVANIQVVRSFNVFFINIENHIQSLLFLNNYVMARSRI